MAAFTYTKRETGEIVETDDPIEFWMALTHDAQEALREQRVARIDAGVHRRETDLLRAERSYVEADIRLSDYVREGANAEDRKARLESQIGESNDIANLDGRIMIGEAAILEAEAETDFAYSRFRLRLRDLEVLAAIYGPREELRGQ